jgi:multicomponent Na+:H+ antiporter subunit D
MGAGAVLAVTGLRRLSDMGGLYKSMPLTLLLYMVGAFAISAVPLFSGFVSKSMVVSAAAESHRPAIFLLLTLASSGTFLHTGLKLPYYMFFGKDRGIRAHEPPKNMLVAMGLTAAACVVIGVAPALLYGYLPYPVDYAPYTLRHVMSTLGLLGFTAFGFFLLLRQLDPHPGVSLDTDWFYRRGSSVVLAFADRGLGRLEALGSRAYESAIRRSLLGVASALRALDASVIDTAAVGVGRLTETTSRLLRRTASGHTQYYGLFMAAGVLVAIAFAVLGR